MFSSRCAGEEVPGIASTDGETVSSQATITWARVAPCRSATRRRAGWSGTPVPPSGKNGTKAMPRSVQSASIRSWSAVRSSTLNLFCTATTGACASASASWTAFTLLTPRCRISPSSRISASAAKGSAIEDWLGIRRR